MPSVPYVPNFSEKQGDDRNPSVKASVLATLIITYTMFSQND